MFGTKLSSKVSGKNNQRVAMEGLEGRTLLSAAPGIDALTLPLASSVSAATDAPLTRASKASSAIATGAALQRQFESLVAQVNPHTSSGTIEYNFKATMKFKAKLANYDRDQFNALLKGVSQPDRTIFAILRATHQTVDTWISDDNLANYATDSSSLDPVPGAFKNSTFQNGIGVLKNMDPVRAAKIIPIIACVNYESSGAKPTWAADSWARVVSDSRTVEIIKRFTFLKLLAAQRKISIPRTSDAVFIWSGAPTKHVHLPLVVWNNSDVPHLKSLAKGSDSFYGAAAIRALKRIGAGNKHL